MTMYLSSSQQERDSATVYRMCSELLGILLGVLIQGQIVSPYRVASKCNIEESTVVIEVNQTVSPQRDRSLEKTAYMLAAGVLGSVFLVSAGVLFIGVREKADWGTRKHDTFFKGFKKVLTFGPYWKLLLASLFAYLAITIIQGNLALYTTIVLKSGDQLANLMAALIVSSIISLPFWNLTLRKLSKKAVFIIGICIFPPIMTGLFFMGPGAIVPAYIVCVISGVGISVYMLVPWTMLPEVLDAYMLKTGERKDALFYSFFVFYTKFAGGVSLGISQIALGIGGYNSDQCKQPDSVTLTLKLLMVPAPVFFTLISIIFMCWYPINKEEAAAIQRALAKKYGEENEIKAKKSKVSEDQEQETSETKLNS